MVEPLPIQEEMEQPERLQHKTIIRRTGLEILAQVDLRNSIPVRAVRQTVP